LRFRGFGVRGTHRKVLSLVLALAALGSAHVVQSESQPSSSQGVTGKVVHVDDGDTITVLLDGNEQLKVRLSSLDAPERSHTNQEHGRVGQPYSRSSQEALARMVKGKVVQLSCSTKDRYQRSVCEVFAGGESVNRAMVAQGWAWAFTGSGGRYLADKSLPKLQESARLTGVGLWAGTDPVAPWEWRKRCWQEGDCTGSKNGNAAGGAPAW
jgi:micrococcal nuclease